MDVRAYLFRSCVWSDSVRGMHLEHGGAHMLTFSDADEDAGETNQNRGGSRQTISRESKYAQTGFDVKAPIHPTCMHHPSQIRNEEAIAGGRVFPVVERTVRQVRSLLLQCMCTSVPENGVRDDGRRRSRPCFKQTFLMQCDCYPPSSNMKHAGKSVSVHQSTQPPVRPPPVPC